MPRPHRAGAFLAAQPPRWLAYLCLLGFFFALGAPLAESPLTSCHGCCMKCCKKPQEQRRMPGCRLLPSCCGGSARVALPAVWIVEGVMPAAVSPRPAPPPGEPVEIGASMPASKSLPPPVPPPRGSL